MTWIKTIRMEEDASVKKAIEDERKLYPAEYATPVQAVFAGVEASIVGSHSLVSRRALSRLQHLRRSPVARIAAETPSARDDRHDGFGHQPVPLLNRISRRVSASRDIE